MHQALAKKSIKQTTTETDFDNTTCNAEVCGSTLYPIDNARARAPQSNRLSYIAYCGVQIWISSQIAESWYIGTSARGWSCKQYSWL